MSASCCSTATGCQEGTTDTILLAITDITERESLRFELEGQKKFAEKLM